MKIIAIDNFDKETISDKIIAENIPNDFVGKIMVDALNEKNSGANASWFYRLVEDDRKLFVFEP